MASKTALIDVVIPVYNARSTLIESVRSVQDQTVKNIRIFLIDDGSSDGSSTILEALAASDDRVVVVRKSNGGIVDALNLGLTKCTGQWIARHDADDISYPQRFERQLAYMEAHAECVAVAPQARHIDALGRWLGTVTTFSNPANSDAKHIPSREPYLIHPFLMVRASALLAIGGYRYVQHAEDTDLYWRLQEHGQLKVLSEVLGDYRYSPTSISSTSVLNGRISAINSQLAAISAVRRRTGRADLDFTKARVQQMADAKSSSRILEIAKGGLSIEEASYLEAAFAAKLLELTSYRPYEIDVDDARFIRSALLDIKKKVPAQQRTGIPRLRAKTLARLLRTGRLKEFKILYSNGIAAYAALYLLVNIGARTLPSSLRRAIRRLRMGLIKTDVGD